jgi:catechol 2,3-dioxygenase-like lactoylglutathione lyase family enzyme
MKIGSVLLGVSDLSTSVRFYRDLAGLELTGIHAGFAFFRTGETSLILSSELIRHSPAAVGATEIVFSVAGVRQQYQELISRGLTFTTEPHVLNGPLWVAHFRDPDGHLLSIMGPENAGPENQLGD